MALPVVTPSAIENVDENQVLVAAAAGQDTRLAGLLLKADVAAVTVNLKRGTTTFFGDYKLLPGEELYLKPMDNWGEDGQFLENRHYYKTGVNEALNLDVTTSGGNVTGSAWTFPWPPA